MPQYTVIECARCLISRASTQGTTFASYGWQLGKGSQESDADDTSLRYPPGSERRCFHRSVERCARRLTRQWTENSDRSASFRCLRSLIFSAIVTWRWNCKEDVGTRVRSVACVFLFGIRVFMAELASSFSIDLRRKWGYYHVPNRSN